VTTDQLVPVYWPYDFLEADAIRQHLQSLGIACHLEGEHQSSIADSGFYGNAGRWRIRLLVRQEVADRVRKVIENHEWPRYT
jgi:hypothetical protein